MKLLRIIFFVATFLSGSSISFAQAKGEFALTLGIGFISHGGLGLKYFFADGLAVEIHAQAIPHTYNLGIAGNIHPIASDRNEYLIVGISKFGGSNPFRKYSRTDGDTLTSAGQSATGLNLGFGHQFKTGEKDRFGFFAFGATDILSAQEQFLNRKSHESVEVRDSSRSWLPFIEGGVMSYSRFTVRNSY